MYLFLIRICWFASVHSTIDLFSIENNERRIDIPNLPVFVSIVCESCTYQHLFGFYYYWVSVKNLAEILSPSQRNCICLLCWWWFCVRKHTNVFTAYLKTEMVQVVKIFTHERLISTYLYYVLNIRTADVLSTKGTRAPVAIILTKLYLNILISGKEGLHASINWKP